MLIESNELCNICVYDMNKQILKIAKNLFPDNADKYYDLETFDIFENEIYILYLSTPKWNIGKYIQTDRHSTAKIFVKKCDNFVKTLYSKDNDEG